MHGRTETNTEKLDAEEPISNATQTPERISSIIHATWSLHHARQCDDTGPSASATNSYEDTPSPIVDRLLFAAHGRGLSQGDP